MTGYILDGVRPFGGEPRAIRVRDRRIVEVAAPGELAGERIDCAGLIALPGLVDLHTHLREPGGEESETVLSGTRAAAAGGFTDVFAMANTDPVLDTPELARQLIGRSAAAAVTVHPVAALTRGLAGTELVDLEALHAVGVTVFSDDGHCLDDASLMQRALTRIAALDAVLAQHAQSTTLAGHGQVNARVSTQTSLPAWDPIGEEAVIARDVGLAAQAGARLHVCHVSTAGSVEVIAWAKRRGIQVTCEVTPHHLLLTDELATTGDPRYKVNPPLRTDEDMLALRRALRAGIIDAVATDHAPHPAPRKIGAWTDAAFGMTGLETALAAVARVATDESGATDWRLVGDVMWRRPARIGSLGHRAATPFVPGAPATLCLVRAGTGWTVDPARALSKSSNTPFGGWTFTDRVEATLVDGVVAYDRVGLLGR